MHHYSANYLCLWSVTLTYLFSLSIHHFSDLPYTKTMCDWIFFLSTCCLKHARIRTSKQIRAPNIRHSFSISRIFILIGPGHLGICFIWVEHCISAKPLKREQTLLRSFFKHNFFFHSVFFRDFFPLLMFLFFLLIFSKVNGVRRITPL